MVKNRQEFRTFIDESGKILILKTMLWHYFFNNTIPCKQDSGSLDFLEALTKWQKLLARYLR